MESREYLSSLLNVINLRLGWLFGKSVLICKRTHHRNAVSTIVSFKRHRQCQAGGVAGMCVDLVLFPLDTIKTRLQSPLGFNKSGGFRGIYAGVPSTAVGSFPNASAFFVTYETVKSLLHPGPSSYLSPLTHMVAASVGEVVACLIRVPSEVVKQRAQVAPSFTTYQMLASTLREEGVRGLYRGYKSTVLREIPFSFVQFPLWEFLKDLWSWKQGQAVESWQSAVCGAFAGGFAAAVTTPLDVAKTRIMLAKAGSSTASGNVLSALSDIWRTQGTPGLFVGIIPRVTAISLGGFIFLGAYDKGRSLLLPPTVKNGQ
uniref:Mitochondrial S-adenosylmethionine carrier protein n=1 Tax=Leptobrachium leishanense TaxID=445787 RepID=A0A8C5R875_9ANUR